MVREIVLKGWHATHAIDAESMLEEGFRHDKTDSCQRWGPGQYAALDFNSINQYIRRWEETGAILRVEARVRADKVLVVDSRVEPSESKWKLWDLGKELGEKLVAGELDAVLVVCEDNDYWTGGNQFVVYDPKRVTYTVCLTEDEYLQRVESGEA